MVKNKSLIVFIIAIIMLTGCQQQEKEIIENVNGEINELEDAEVMTEEEPLSTIVEKKYVELKNASNFSEGIAWVRFEDEFGEDHIGWLDMTGKITVPEALVTTERFGGEFSGGYTYVNYDNDNDNYYDSFVVLDQEGNVTASSPEGKGFGIVAGGDGIFLVKQMVRTFDTNHDLYGVIDAAGNWLYELTADNPFPSSTPEGYSQVTFTYHGDFVFSVHYLRNESWYRYYMFNVATGVTTEYEDYTPMNFYGGKTVLDSKDQFENEISFITADGEVIHTIAPEYGEMNFGPICGEGLMFAGDYCYDPDAEIGIVEKGKFYNMDGSVAIDLSQYTLVETGAHDLYCFKDGVAPIVLLGADYSPYLSFINTSGELMFEPIEVESYYAKHKDAFGVYSDGVVPTIMENEAGSSINVIINSNGVVRELGGNVDECKDMEFHNGYTVKSENYMVSSDTSSTRYYFMGMDGEVLETYLEQ